jgi:hypothetical protein
MGEHDEDEEHAQARGWNREEIDGDQVPDVIGEERPSAMSGTAACAASASAERQSARPP